MNFRRRAAFCAFALGLVTCEAAPQVHIPQFADGGLLRTGTPLNRQQLYFFEGIFNTEAGGDVFGGQMAVRTAPGTISLLTDKNAGFAPLQAACLPDRSVVLEGYWQYPTRADTGLVRLFVDPPAMADALCNGQTPTASTDLKLDGVYGNGDDFPDIPFTLGWNHELKPFRGTFFTVAHHGACEITDHCGASPNTLESVRLAERIGSNAAELDIRVTRDGIPIFFHDPGLSGDLVQGAFCHGQVADLSLAEIRGSCRAQYGEVIPTAQEMLDMMVAQTELEGVYLDMKVPEGVLPVARIASKIVTDLRMRNTNTDPNDDRHFSPVIGIPAEDVLNAWHAAKATLMQEGLEIPPCLVEYDPDIVIAEDCLAWGPTWTQGPRVSDVQRVRAAGAGTIFWTINQTDFINQFLTEAQPNGIISARAALLFFRYQAIGTPPPKPTRSQQ
jgi:glycerophosphoryl diester phosphodiesterase